MAPALALPSELTIYTVGELRPQWLGWLADHDDETLQADASAVAEVDAAGLQLVLSLQQALAREQRTLVLAQPSRLLAEAFAALGMALPAGEALQ